MSQESLDVFDEALTGFSLQEHNSSRLIKQLSLISSEGGEALNALTNLLHFDALNWCEVYSTNNRGLNKKAGLRKQLRKHSATVKIKLKNRS